MIRLFLAGALTLALCACAQNPAPAPEPNPPPIAQRPNGFDPAAAKTCEQRGGSYQIGGLLGRFYCTIPFSDGGKPCTDKSDCQGRCLAKPEQAMGSKAIGACAPNDSMFGCNAPIQGGVVGPTLCVD